MSIYRKFPQKIIQRITGPLSDSMDGIPRLHEHRIVGFAKTGNI